MAVYTEISDEELAAFTAKYDIGETQSLKGITEGVSNSNYFLQTDKDIYILTIYEERTDLTQLPYFIDLMKHLAKKGFTAPMPVDAKDGNALQEICGKKACLTTFLKGMFLRRFTPEQCGQLGAAIAKMQIATQDFTGFRKNNLSVDGWGAMIDKIGTRANEIADGLYDEICADYDFLRRHWPADLPQSVIHADLFPDNVFFLGKKLSGVIDFYFACNDFAAYELAICLNAWCFEPDTWEMNATKAYRMLSSYNALRPLSPDERDALPVLAHGAALRFFLTRAEDWLFQKKDAVVKLKDPMEYVKKLRFHRGIRSWHEYGWFG